MTHKIRIKISLLLCLTILSGFLYSVPSLGQALSTLKPLNEVQISTSRLPEKSETLNNFTWGGEFSDTGINIALDTNENIYVLGSKGTGALTYLALIKWDSTGQLLWEQILQMNLM